MNSGLYKITHNTTGRVYVGQTSNFTRRKREHFKTGSSSCPKLAAAIAYYGADAFSFTPLVVCPIGGYLDTLEEAAIAALGALDGFNLSSVGRASPMLSKRVSRKAGNTQRLKARRGEHQSQRPEWREAHALVMRTAMEKRLADGTHTSTDPVYRKKVSDTLRLLAKEGKHPCQEQATRDKISASIKGRVWVQLRGRSRQVVKARLPSLLQRGWSLGRPTGSAGLRLKAG